MVQCQTGNSFEPVEELDTNGGLALACASKSEAAPSVAVFDGWAPRTQAERATDG